MVRYYANAGLVRSTRDVNGYRDFDATQVTRVRQIQALLGLGLTITQITDLLPCLGNDPEVPSCPAARKAIERRLHTIDAQIATLTTLRARIVDVLDLPAAVPPGTVPRGISAGADGQRRRDRARPSLRHEITNGATPLDE
ncbi:MerR family transcriptional regulator [Nocardia tengchongensis]